VFDSDVHFIKHKTCSAFILNFYKQTGGVEREAISLTAPGDTYRCYATERNVSI